MNELITITPRVVGDGEIQTVNARELHAFLEVETRFDTWLARRIEAYGFVEENDFCSFLSESQGGRPSTEYALSLSMAKELSMVERTNKGKQARQYFIECERRLRSQIQTPAAPTLQHFEQMLIGWKAAEERALTAEKRVVAIQGHNQILSEHNQELQQQNSLIVETAETLIAILGPKNNMSLRDAANRLQQPQKAFNELLNKRGWIYRQPTALGEQPGRWRPYASHIASGNLVDREWIQDRVTGKSTPIDPDFGYVDPTKYRTFIGVGVTNTGLMKIIQFNDLPNPSAPALIKERQRFGV